MTKNFERVHAEQVTADKIPMPHLPHVAIAGRSNVGKSTLVNAILGRQFAKISRNPGRTKAIYCYEIREKHPWVLSDLPGFGYAKVSLELRKIWQSWTGLYFHAGSPVRATILCVDSKIPRQPVDEAFLHWLAEQEKRQVILVGTKSDRMNQKTKVVALRQLSEWASDIPGLDITPLLISAEKGTNMNILRSQISLALS